LGGFKLVRSAVAGTVHSARWWLWGSFVSNHVEAVTATDQVMKSLVILPVRDLPQSDGGLAMLVGFRQVAERNHRVDAPRVYEFEPGGRPSSDDLDMATRFLRAHQDDSIVRILKRLATESGDNRKRRDLVASGKDRLPER
jgi:hypothetical protein